MASTDSLRLGLIGCGEHASTVLVPAIVKSPFRLAAVCDLDLDRAREVAGVTGAKVFGDHRVMLDRADLDAVAVVGPPGMHAAVGLDVLESGRHLFVEKPPGSNLVEARALADTAARNGRLAMVGFMKRHATAYRRARQLIAEPGFGRLGLAKITYSHWEFAGIRDHLLYMSIHAIDLARFFAGDVVAGTVFKRAVGSNHIIVLMLEHAGGALSNLSLSALSPRVQETVELEGDSTLIEVRNLVDFRYQHRAPRFDDARDTDERMSSTWYPDFAICWNQNESTFLQGYAPEFIEFATAIRERRPPRPGLADGVEAMRLIEAIVAAPEGRSELVVPA